MKLFDNTMPRTRKALLLTYAAVMAYRTYVEGRAVLEELKADRHRRKVSRFIATDPFLNDTWQDDTVAGVHIDDLQYKGWHRQRAEKDIIEKVTREDEVIYIGTGRFLNSSQEDLARTHHNAMTAATWVDPTGFPDPELLVDIDPYVHGVEPLVTDYWCGDAIRGWTPKPNPHKAGTREYSIWAHNQDLTSF